MMNNIAYVYYKDIFAGTLVKSDSGFIFTYDDFYFKNKKNRPISLLFPLDKQEYQSNTLFPFFDGLIPEGWLLEVAIKRYKLDYKDRFQILLETCSDCIGAVSIRKEKIDG